MICSLHIFLIYTNCYLLFIHIFIYTYIYDHLRPETTWDCLIHHRLIGHDLWDSEGLAYDFRAARLACCDPTVSQMFAVHCVCDVLWCIFFSYPIASMYSFIYLHIYHIRNQPTKCGGNMPIPWILWVNVRIFSNDFIVCRFFDHRGDRKPDAPKGFGKFYEAEGRDPVAMAVP